MSATIPVAALVASAGLSLVPPRPPLDVDIDFLPPSFPKGMTLRDLFAAFASVGVMAMATNSYGPGLVASHAYDIADAMLRRREYGTAH